MTGQQHGAVAGRVAGAGNTAEVEGPARTDLGDPAGDLVGTWRLAPGGDQYDLAATRAVRIGLAHDPFPWSLVDPEERSGHGSFWLSDDEVRDWTVTPTSVVGAAARLHRAATQTPRVECAPAPSVLPSDECERPFR